MADGQVALITGGTRRIGLAIARRLAQEGYALALVYREDESAAAAALAELRPVARAVTILRLDVATPEGAGRAVRETQHVLDSVDLLVNNAGPFIPGSLVETDLDAYHLMVGGNLGAVFYLCRAAIPLMREQGSGHIINIGSLNAEVARGAPNAAVYHALKAGIVVLTRSIARSEGRYGIRANVVNPGMVDTLGVGKDIIDSIPLRRLGTGNDIANAVAWLAGDEASYVSGAVLNVHGGLWA
jgi:3-oxoacyl-[acyl-carrier protein] reductase